MPGFAPEGYPFVGFFAAVTLIAYIASGGWLSVAPFTLMLFMFYFFRDPERKAPEGEGIYVSPADGKVILIKDIFEKDYIKKDVRMMSIFMSPLNVHVNRSPCDATVRAVKYTPGSKKSAYTEEAHLKNENIAMLLEEKDGSMVLLRQVAGSVARRAVCRAKAGDFLKKGERFGIIKFSSRVDIYLPPASAFRVNVGDRVLAGETIIAVKG
jgi:phosphatidylserine decarboxylase